MSNQAQGNAELGRLLRAIMEHRGTLSRQEARHLLEILLEGEAEPAVIGAVLGGLAARGETAEELAGFVDTMRAAALEVPLTDEEREGLVDTCGTGGDVSGTFNISTGAALVAAGAGATVAKHGNRAVTSTSGSADVLEALGVPVGLGPEKAADALRRFGFAYLHAPAMHPAMKAVMPVRRALGFRTAFNLLGPLTNPAAARAQVMGVYSADRIRAVAEAMVLLGTRHAFVVHGEGEDGQGLDEISISGPTQVAEVRDGTIVYATLTPEELGVKRAPIAALAGGDAVANAAILRRVFAGEAGAPRDIVVVNAAAVLVVAGLAEDLPDGVTLAAATIDSGQVASLIAGLAGE